MRSCRADGKFVNSYIHEEYTEEEVIDAAIDFLNHKSIDGRHSWLAEKTIFKDMEEANKINNCENCHYYNSMIDWNEGVFHQCLMGNKLWLKCNDYDPIEEDKE